MKKTIILVILALSLIPISADAEYYMGLYTSSDRICSCWLPFEENFWARIEMWVWILPSTKGLIGAEFGVQYPENIMQFNTTYNPALSPYRVGELPDGVSGAFSVCQMSWVWFCRLELWVTSGDQAEIPLVPYAGQEAIRLASCEMGYPTYSPTILAHLLVNTEPAPMICCLAPLSVFLLETEATSWGAIKGLFGN